MIPNVVANTTPWYTEASTVFGNVWESALGWLTSMPIAIFLFGGVVMLAMKVFKRAKRAVK